MGAAVAWAPSLGFSRPLSVQTSGEQQALVRHLLGPHERSTTNGVAPRDTNVSSPIMEAANPQSRCGRDTPPPGTTDGLVIKNPPATQDTRVPSLGQEDPLEEEMADTLQCSCLENPMDRGAWRATVHGVTKSRTRLSN